jgi:YkoY family integral membrane protein
MFGQTFSPGDLGIVALLVLLEGVLSLDNAIVLALLARPLSKEQQVKALTYGLAGAVIFRLIAVGAAAYLMRWRIVKLIGGAYLIWIAVKHLWSHYRKKPEEQGHAATQIDHLPVKRGHTGFWTTVALIELTDIAFAIDSILAAIALVGSQPAGSAGVHPKLWVVFTGGVLGVASMRIAAAVFIKLLERFPGFEVSAYLLVQIIGLKLLAEWHWNTAEQPHRLDFQDLGSTAFWIFWGLMALCVAAGFLPSRRKAPLA